MGVPSEIWFLGVYLLVITLVPLTWALHRRFEWKAVIAFIVAAVAVDTVVRAGTPVVGAANVFFVQRGLYAPETPWPLSVVGIGVLLGGLAALGALRPRPPSLNNVGRMNRYCTRTSPDGLTAH